MSQTNFTSVFVAVFFGTALVVASLLLNERRPAGDVDQPSASFVKATGKCAECHRRETSSVVHQYEMSQHAAKNVNCLDCHKPVEGQQKLDHKGFEIAKELTSKNCAECHKTEYEQFLRSRHAAPAWAAVAGAADFTEQQIAFAEKYHKGTIKRPHNKLSLLEGPAAIKTEDGRLRLHVMFAAAGRDEGSVMEDVMAEIDRWRAAQEVDPIPTGVAVKPAGRYESQVRARKRFAVLIPVCLGVILFLLYLNFRSWPTVFNVFAAVPVVIAGGLIRIGAVVSGLVPFMIVVYFLAVAGVLAVFYEELPRAIGLIFTDAFRAGFYEGDAVFGGALGGLIVLGARRAAFSNEAGIGTAPMAHGAAKTAPNSGRLERRGTPPPLNPGVARCAKDATQPVGRT